jgi:hypothetical protein
MTEKKSLVEEAILQMKNLEEAVAENAKGILASTMRQEIKDLVKESLKEEEDDEEIESDDEMEDSEDIADIEFSDEDEDMDEMDMDDEMEDEDEMDMEDEDEMDMSELDMEGDTIDLTNQPTSQVLKVFKLLSPEDEIIVTKDDSGNINLKDNATDKEYMIVSEGEFGMDEEMYEMEDEMYEMDDMGKEMYEMEDEMYEMNHMDEEMYEMEDELNIEDELEDVFSEEDTETIYEVELDDESEFDLDEMDSEEEEFMMESKKMKKGFKPKGMNLGDAKSYKISPKPNMEGGFKVVKTKADKTMGTGSASSFKYGKVDDGDFKIKPKARKETKEGMMKMPKKMETKEASRTYAMGSKSGRGLRKGITPNRNLTFESTDSQELNLLREKNEEYRKALNIFRNKLNEVAIFNSNLAYATRLFTEHSTSKQEKINILKRFDGVETLKESKNLYKVIKDELSSNISQPITESVERTIEKTPSTGSAINLIESKTYENPQFMRMKDLMSKLK